MFLKKVIKNHDFQRPGKRFRLRGRSMTLSLQLLLSGPCVLCDRKTFFSTNRHAHTFTPYPFVCMTAVLHFPSFHLLLFRTAGNSCPKSRDSVTQSFLTAWRFVDSLLSVGERCFLLNCTRLTQGEGFPPADPLLHENNCSC